MSMRPVRFTVQLFGRYPSEARTEQERKRSERDLLWLLLALSQIDVQWLKDFPDTPSIYTPGKVIYRPEIETEDWEDIPTILRIGYGDCEDLGCARVAELRQARIPSQPWISWRRRPDGGLIYHTRTWRKTADTHLPPLLVTPDGRKTLEAAPDGGWIEDPSLVLGMGWKPESVEVGALDYGEGPLAVKAWQDALGAARRRAGRPAGHVARPPPRRAAGIRVPKKAPSISLTAHRIALPGEKTPSRGQSPSAASSSSSAPAPASAPAPDAVSPVAPSTPLPGGGGGGGGGDGGAIDYPSIGPAYYPPDDGAADDGAADDDASPDDDDADDDPEAAAS